MLNSKFSAIVNLSKQILQWRESAFGGQQILNSKKSGFSLIIAMMLMTLTVSTVLGIVSLFLREFKLNTDLKYSTQAFYAAETGIEKYLWEFRRNGSGNRGTFSCATDCLGNGATYSLEYDFTGEVPFYILSTGDFRGIKRAIRTIF